MGIQTSFIDSINLTGSLQGTSSFAITASYVSGTVLTATSASYVNITGSGVLVNYNGSQIQLTGSTFPFTGSARISGSLLVSGAILTNTLIEGTASNAVTASYVNIVAGQGVTINRSGSQTEVSMSAAALPIPTGSLQARFVHAGTIYEISPSYQTNTYDLYNLGTVVIQSGSMTASFGDLVVSNEGALFSEYLYNAGTIINNGTLQVAPNVKQ